MGAVTVSGLTLAAGKYDPILRMLPFLTLQDALAALEINLKEVTYKDTLIQFQRKGGTSKPYAAGVLDNNAEIGKMEERSLIVLPCYNAIKDHIMNYADKAILNPGGVKVDNQTKKHPLEQVILEAQVRTIGEDIIDAIFPAVRDNSDKSPQGMMDGYGHIIATEIAASTISVANKNYSTSSALTAPTTDTVAIDRLVAWLRKANMQLLKDGVLYIAPSALYKCQDALSNVLKYKSDNGFNALLEYLRAACHSPKLRIISDACLGTGDQLILTKPRNFDLGMNTKTDGTFLSVRNPYEDPNYVQFWSQWELGARINSLHAKEFFCNEEVNVGVELAGDYTS